MPHRPVALDPEAQRRATPRYPYEAIAADLGRRVKEGSLTPEDDVPTAAALAVDHDVSLATAKRALVLAQEWGLLERSDRNSLRVVALERPPVAPEIRSPSSAAGAPGGARTMLTFTLRHRGARVTRFSAVADVSDSEALEQLLIDAVARSGRSADLIGEYEMDVECAGVAEPLMTLVIARQRG